MAHIQLPRENKNPEIYTTEIYLNICRTKTAKLLLHFSCVFFSDLVYYIINSVNNLISHIILSS